jgi:hypothetical protein
VRSKFVAYGTARQITCIYRTPIGMAARWMHHKAALWLAKGKGWAAYKDMPRITIPVVEVTAPDGTKSFWGVYSIPYDEAVAVARAKLPAKYTVELSFRRLGPRRAFDGARPGDIFKLDNPAAPERAVRFTSGRSVSLPAQLVGTAMEDLDQVAAQLTAAVLDMPPGDRRQDALREIGRLRSRMCALLRSATKSHESTRRQSSHSLDVGK